VATHLMMVAYNKAHGLLSRTECNTVSHYVISSWDLKGTVSKSTGVWVLFNINCCCCSWKWRSQNVCTL